MIESIRYIKWCSLQASRLRECKVGLKINNVREMERGIPENGFWSSVSVAHFTFYNVAFLWEVWGGGASPRGCAVVSTKWKAYVLLSLDLERPTGVMRYVGINCPSTLEVLNCFSPTVFHLSHFALNFPFPFLLSVSTRTRII